MLNITQNTLDINLTLSYRSSNTHYITRYLKFINSRTITNNIGVHRHHILPKAEDMFPEFSNLTINPWNCCILTYREHFIAHVMLAKIFPKTSQYSCLLHMKNASGKNISSKLYHELKEHHSKSMIGNTFKLGKKESDETRLRKSISHTGIKRPHIKALGNKSRTDMITSKDTLKKQQLARMRNSNKAYYYNPSTKENRLFTLGSEPPGWLKGRKSKLVRILIT